MDGERMSFIEWLQDHDEELYHQLTNGWLLAMEEEE